jgi:sugar O-acyltransferase (sialic acid O-acetyltransferase NeuD family)
MKASTNREKNIGIIGAGGLGKEALCCLGEMLGWDHLSARVKFLVEKEFFKEQQLFGVEVLLLEEAIDQCDEVVIAIGDSAVRQRIISGLPKRIGTPNVIHPNCAMTPYTRIEKGAVILGNVLLSCDVKIGAFAVINPGTTISHDTVIGNYFSASPGVNISGNCTIGDRVFMGTNASTRNGIVMGDDIVVGMGAVVVKDILKPGTYVGNPAVLVE